MENETDIFATMNIRNASKRRNGIIKDLQNTQSGIAEVMTWLENNDITEAEYDLYVIANIKGIYASLSKAIRLIERNRQYILPLKLFCEKQR